MTAVMWPGIWVRLASTVLLALGSASCQLVTPFTGCQASAPVKIGDWWIEVGGPNAHFNIEPGTLRPGPDPWLVIVRLEPNPSDEGDVAAWLERVDGSDRTEVAVNSRVNPANLFRFDSRAPQLPGGWFLLQVPIEAAGCWRIAAAVDGAPVGSAVLDIPAN